MEHTIGAPAGRRPPQLTAVACAGHGASFAGPWPTRERILLELLEPDPAQQHGIVTAAGVRYRLDLTPAP